MRTYFILGLLSLPALAAEPIPEERGAAGLARALKALRTTASVMHVCAHPDDEDGGMLVWLTRGLGADVTLLTLNRGEGGANLVTSDFFDALGALRTLELLKAGEFYGVRQFFTSVADFGFSKRLDETLEKWGRDRVVGEVVRLIRTERPDVIVSRFQGAPRDGHGNHQAAGLIAKLAFEAAGDESRFPEQGLKAWQPKKLYIGNVRAQESWTVRVPSGDYDPLLGRSYFQIAREGLRYQRSQGIGGAAAAPGAFHTYYRLEASRVAKAEKESGFFDRLETTLTGAAREAGASETVSAALALAEAGIDRAWNAFSSGDFSATARPLASALGEIRKAHAGARGHLEFLLARKQRQIQAALAKALGLDFQAGVDGPAFQHAIPGQAFEVSASAVNRSRVPVAIRRAELRAPAGSAVEPLSGSPVTLGYNESARFRFRVRLPDDAEATRPHWRRDSIQDAAYEILDPDRAGEPLPRPPVSVTLTYAVDGQEAAAETVVEAATSHRHALAITPAISVRFNSEMGVIPSGRGAYDVRLAARSNVKGPASGSLALELPAGWKADPLEAPLAFDKENEELEIGFRVSPAAGASGIHAIRAVARMSGRDYRDGYVTITYPGLERVNLYRAAVHRVSMVDVKIAPGIRAGYVMGSGDEVPSALASLGVAVEMLDAPALAAGDLARFDVILLGVRAYAARDDLKTHNARLLEYVRTGGTLIVQYQTQEYDHNYAPYPYQQTPRAEEVSEEDAPVRILEPAHPVFHFPNRIAPADFDGWVEQRGSKFFMSWDPRWTPLVESHDTGQEPQRGGWLEARYGKGRYIYCAYAWYRQLPNAVPGAYRLVANLLSLPRAPAP